MRDTARVDSLRHTVTRRDDEVELLERPRFGGARKEREEPSIVGDGAREPLEPRCVDGSSLHDLTRDAPLEMEEREDLRLRDDLENRLENLLPASHAGQPVVNDRDSQPGEIGNLRQTLELRHRISRDPCLRAHRACS